MIKNDLSNLSKPYLYNDLSFSDDSIEETPSDEDDITEVIPGTPSTTS